MPEKQKPEYDVVKKAAHLINTPEDATLEDIKRMSARILNDERNAPDPNKTVPKSKLSLLYNKPK
jgi:hypothetical protein